MLFGIPDHKDAAEAALMQRTALSRKRSEKPRKAYRICTTSATCVCANIPPMDTAAF